MRRAWRSQGQNTAKRQRSHQSILRRIFFAGITIASAVDSGLRSFHAYINHFASTTITQIFTQILIPVEKEAITVKHSLKLAVLVATIMAVPGALAQGPGASIYKGKCEMCHGAHGKASTSTGKMMHAPSFKKSSIKNAPDSKLESIIKNGKNKMPAFKNKLSDKQIKQVVAYIRTLEKQ